MRHILNVCMLCSVFLAWNVFAEEREKVEDVLNSLFLFGLDLDTATRDEMREAIKKRGGRVIKENCDHNVDVYDARHMLDGAFLFEMRFTDEGKFAMARYEFAEYCGFSTFERLQNKMILNHLEPNFKCCRFFDDEAVFWKIEKTYLDKMKNFEREPINFLISLEKYFNANEVRLLYLHVDNFRDYCIHQKHITLHEIDFNFRKEAFRIIGSDGYRDDAF